MKETKVDRGRDKRNGIDDKTDRRREDGTNGTNGTSCVQPGLADSAVPQPPADKTFVRGEGLGATLEGPAACSPPSGVVGLRTKRWAAFAANHCRCVGGRKMLFPRFHSTTAGESSRFHHLPGNQYIGLTEQIEISL